MQIEACIHRESCKATGQGKLIASGSIAQGNYQAFHNMDQGPILRWFLREWSTRSTLESLQEQTQLLCKGKIMRHLCCLIWKELLVFFSDFLFSVCMTVSLPTSYSAPCPVSLPVGVCVPVFSCLVNSLLLFTIFCHPFPLSLCPISPSFLALSFASLNPSSSLSSPSCPFFLYSLSEKV